MGEGKEKEKHSEVTIKDTEQGGRKHRNRNQQYHADEKGKKDY